MLEHKSPHDPEHSATPIVAQWAQFITGLNLSQIPAATLARGQQSLLDHLACAVAGSRNAAALMLADYLVSCGSAPQATVDGRSERLSSRDAAMINSAFVHSTELWEFFDRAAMPPNIVIPAVVLALAEREGSSGAEAMTALVAGYEIAIRAGLAIRVDPSSPTWAAKPNDRAGGRDGPMGFHLSGATFGTYGATAAAARLLRLDPSQTAHALTISTSLTPAIGLERSAAPEQAMPKDIYMAATAAAATTAAELARRGFTGRTDVTAHFAALVADAEPELLVRGLGRDYLLDSGGLHPKLTAGSAYTQSAAAAAIELRRAAGFALDDVRQIVVETGERAARKEGERNPATLVAARASLPYIVAAILVHSEAELADDPLLTRLYTGQWFDHRQRQALSQLVTVVGSAAYERALEVEWPQRAPGRVTIILRSGAELSVAKDMGVVAAERTDADVAAKFHALADAVLGPAAADEIIERALALEEQSDVTSLMAAMSTPAR